jgi:MtN3 and saliva related transmembrane protein
MEPFAIELVGYIGASLTTAAFFPQTWKVIRTGDTKAISLAMYVLFTTGIFFWLAYGVMIRSIPIVFANTITLVLSSIILWMKIKAIRISEATGL